jgi:glucose-1-phosphate cytidylyltransferase
MKAVILAGGFGTRISEETTIRPKPMVEIGGKPILWHIMKIYYSHGINEFIIAAGYKSEIIKEYFINFYAFNNDITINLAKGETTIHDGNQPAWTVHIIHTGLNTQTGGRVKKLKKYIEHEDAFMLTYGDAVADVNISELIAFHKSHGKIATVTTVRTPARFGRIGFHDNQVTEFFEKPVSAEGWINGGFFVLKPQALDYIEGDETIWERDPIERLAHDGQLMGYRHYGFWSCMDTLKEKNILEDLWNSGNAPWKAW